MPRFTSVPGQAPHAPAALAALQRALQELHSGVLGAHWDLQVCCWGGLGLCVGGRRALHQGHTSAAAVLARLR